MIIKPGDYVYRPSRIEVWEGGKWNRLLEGPFAHQDAARAWATSDAGGFDEFLCVADGYEPDLGSEPKPGVRGQWRIVAAQSEGVADEP